MVHKQLSSWKCTTSCVNGCGFCHILLGAPTPFLWEVFEAPAALQPFLFDPYVKFIFVLRVKPFYFEGQRHFTQRGRLLHVDIFFKYRFRKRKCRASALAMTCTTTVTQAAISYECPKWQHSREHPMALQYLPLGLVTVTSSRHTAQRSLTRAGHCTPPLGGDRST